MRLPCLALLAVLAWPWAATADPVEVRTFEVRIAGLRVADLVLTGWVAEGRYAATGTLRTTGLAGALRRVRFAARVEGRITPAGPRPERYAEQIDTGRRRSEASLVWEGGTVRQETEKGAADAAADSVAEPAAAGAVDPLTALWFGLADVAPEAACRYAAATFDGTRHAEVRLSPIAGQPSCAGRFRRLSGYGAAELAERRAFAFTLHLAPGPGDLLRVERVEVETIYGKAVLNRR